MGIASYDVTGDGYPEVYLTSQGPNTLQTLLAGPAAADLPRHRRSSAASTATRPSTGGDPLPSTAWHPEFEDVNNDGFIDLFVSKGNVDAQPDYATKRPEQPPPRPAGRDVRPGAPRRPASSTSPAAAEPRSPTSTSTACSTSSRSISVTRSGSGGTSASGTADAPAPMGHWLGVRLAPAGPQPRRDRRLDRGPGRRPVIGAARADVGGGHVSGQLGWTHVGLGPATRGRGPRHRGRTASRALAARRPRTSSRSSSAARPRSGPWTPPRARRRRDDRPSRARLARIDLPDFGMPDREPGAPAVAVRGAARRLSRARADARGYDRLVVYADREHSANLVVPDRLRPAVRGGDPGRRADDDPAILVGNECCGMAGAAPLPMRRHLFQDLSLPGQPRDRSRPLGEILGEEGIGRGQPGRRRRLEAVRGPVARSRCPRSSSTSCAR